VLIFQFVEFDRTVFGEYICRAAVDWHHLADTANLDAGLKRKLITPAGSNRR
jgi:hypothetical protein